MLSWRCSNIFTAKNKAREEIVEKKSRFIASVYPIENKEEAESIINEVKKEFWDARHNVYAYILPNNISRYSDDGEPQGTAGLPVYNVLQKKNIINVLVIVTRYFGGILLGKGGLVRAYTEATIKGLNSSNIYEIINYKEIEIVCEYKLKDKVLFFIEKEKIIFNAEYSDKVKIIVKLPEDKVSKFVQELVKITENKITYQILSKKQDKKQ